MPSSRRIKVLAVLLAATVMMILYFTGDARRSRSQDFYSRTVAAMDAKAATLKETVTDADITRKLKDAADAAKKAVVSSGPAKLPPPPPGSPVDEISLGTNRDGEEKGGAGRKKMKGGEKWDMATGKEAAMVEKEGEPKEETAETKKEHEVEVVLNDFLKRSPILVFSKSYCGYSKKAKAILLDKYTIVPAPFVVELDQHSLGPELQSALEKRTGRGTVPNVLINGKSIGGGDEVAALDTGGELVNKVKSMGGKRIMEAKLTE